MRFHPVCVIKAKQVWEKYWLVVDKKSKYLINGFPYAGKDETRSASKQVSDHVVMQLVRP